MKHDSTTYIARKLDRDLTLTRRELRRAKYGIGR